MAEDTREGRYLLEARDVGLRYRLEGSPDSGPRRFGIGRRPKRDHWALRDVSFGLAEGAICPFGLAEGTIDLEPEAHS